MSSTKPPWPATAGLIIVSISSWTFCLSSTLMASPLHRYFTRKSAEGQLALRGLRSAEPGLGQAWRALATGWQHRRGARRRAGQLVSHAPHAAERRRGLLTPVGSPGDARRAGPAQAGQLGEPFALAEEVLDLRREVEREGGERRVERPHHAQRVAGAVQEIGIAEGDVGRARLDLLADVREHDRLRHHEEAPPVD